MMIETLIHMDITVAGGVKALKPGDRVDIPIEKAKKLFKLAQIGRDRLEEVRSVHTESGRHENVRTPFPGWVQEDVAASAEALSSEAARAQLPEPVRRLVFEDL